MLTELMSLWLPILVSAAGVFVTSFVFWAATPWHHKDVRPLPDPDAGDRAIEGLALPPGFYMLGCTHDAAQCKSQAYQDRMNRGPWASITVFSGKPSMGRNMALSFLVCLVVSLIIGYLSGTVLAPGADAMIVFRVACTAGLLAYTFGGMTNGIWFGKPAGWVVRDIIDAVVYAAITGAAFAWLWPAGAVVPLG